MSFGKGDDDNEIDDQDCTGKKVSPLVPPPLVDDTVIGVVIITLIVALLIDDCVIEPAGT